MRPNKNAAALIMAGLFVSAAAHSLEMAETADNGTDPTKLSSKAWIQMEHLNLRDGFSSDTLEFYYQMPINRRSSFGVTLPVVRSDTLGDNNFGVGDLRLKLSYLFALTRHYGIVLQGELAADTASRTELGTGQTVFKGTVIYAKFLKGGGIFAPAFVQSNSLWSDSARAKVNTTTFDFYYVPKLDNPRYFVTFDPALNFNWETDKQYASLAVTMGYTIGPAFGGNGQVFIKPSVFAGGERPTDWGIQVGYRVIGF